jgi:hypothetical protein
MEVAINTPAMVSSYYFPNPEKCWGIHIHDRWLDNTDVPPTRDLEKVIYLFREGKDTVYSQLRYDKTIPDEWDGNSTPLIDREVDAVTSQYEAHLLRWRFNREDIKSYMEVRYEDMIRDTKTTFNSVFEFLKIECSDEDLEYAIKDATKEKIDSLIIDHHAMDKSSAYNPQKHIKSKSRFKELYGEKIDKKLDILLR